MPPSRIPTHQLALSKDRNYSATHAVDTVATANITVTDPGATISGRTMVAGDTVLLTAQTAPTENGKYVWTDAAEDLVRTIDFNDASQWLLGTRFYCRLGDHAGKMYVLSALTTDPPVLGTDSGTFSYAGTDASYVYYHLIETSTDTDGIENEFSCSGMTEDSYDLMVFRNGVLQVWGQDFQFWNPPIIGFFEVPAIGDLIVVSWKNPG